MALTSNPWYRFGAVAVVVVGVATLAFVNNNSTASNDSPASNDSTTSNTAGGEALDPICEIVKRFGGNPDFLADLLSDTHAELDAVTFPNLSRDDIALCLDPYQAVVIVEGVPGVSGIYSSLAGNVALSGYGAVDGPEQWYSAQGQCFVGNDGEQFQTKAIYTQGTETYEGFKDLYEDYRDQFDLGHVPLTAEQYEALNTNTFIVPGAIVTIDVGITLGGGPFAAIVVDSPEKTEAFFQPAAFDGNAVIDVNTNRTELRENPWAGVATLKTTTYNNRDWLPYEDAVYTGSGARWQGDPTYNMNITVLCG